MNLYPILFNLYINKATIIYNKARCLCTSWCRNSINPILVWKLLISYHQNCQNWTFPNGVLILVGFLIEVGLYFGLNCVSNFSFDKNCRQCSVPQLVYRKLLYIYYCSQKGCQLARTYFNVAVLSVILLYLQRLNKMIDLKSDKKCMVIIDRNEKS